MPSFYEFTDAAKKFADSFKPNWNLRENTIDFLKIAGKTVPPLTAATYTTLLDAVRGQVEEFHQSTDFFIQLTEELATTDVAIMLSLFATFYATQNQVGPYLINRFSCNRFFASEASPYHVPERGDLFAPGGFYNSIDDGNSILDGSESGDSKGYYR